MILIFNIKLNPITHYIINDYSCNLFLFYIRNLILKYQQNI